MYALANFQGKVERQSIVKNGIRPTAAEKTDAERWGEVRE